MNNSKIGIANSLFKENNYDPFITAQFAVDNGIKTVQIYLNKELERAPKDIVKIREFFGKNNLTMIVHSPYYLGKEVTLDSRHTAALTQLFPSKQKKYAVFHFDENCSSKEALKAIEDLNRAGITVALENFYQKKSEKALWENINEYIDIFRKANAHHFDIVPVFDIPRLYVTEFIDYSPTTLIGLILNELSKINKDIIFHIIDSASSNQEREDWVEIGKGIIDYNTIIETIDSYKFNVISYILEYEDIDLGKNSFEILNDLIL